jgi:hypothetical protein
MSIQRLQADGIKDFPGLSGPAKKEKAPASQGVDFSSQQIAPSWQFAMPLLQDGEGAARALHDSQIGGSMADDLKQTGKPDDQRINPDQDHEMGYWADKLRVSRDELRRAIQQVGPMVKDVERHLSIWTAPKAGERPLER